MRHAVIGTGYGANVHIPAFGMDAIALCDSGSGKAKDYAPAHCRAFSDWRRMLDVVKPDSISVVVPPHEQYKIVTEALAREIHVLCEKPMGANLEEAERLLATSHASTSVAAVGFQFRYEPGISLLAKLIHQGELGKLQRIGVQWITSGRSNPHREWCWQHDKDAGGGVWLAFATHIVDLLNWFTKGPIRPLSSCSEVLIRKRPDSSGKIMDVTAEDSVDAILRLADGGTANISITNCQPQGSGLRIQVYGEEGRAEFTHTWPFKSENASLIKDLGQGQEKIDLLRLDEKMVDSRVVPAQNLISDFRKAILRNENPTQLPTFDDGYRVHQLIDSLQKLSVNNSN